MLARAQPLILLMIFQATPPRHRALLSISLPRAPPAWRASSARRRLIPVDFAYGALRFIAELTPPCLVQADAKMQPHSKHDGFRRYKNTVILGMPIIGSRRDL